jgi:Domain of unknown function (DUF4189)
MTALRFILPAVLLSLLAAPAALAADAPWNALAIDSKGASGFAMNQSSEDKANALALKECGGGDCEIMTTIQSQCLSLADNAAVMADEGYLYGWSYGQTRLGTETIALGYCYDSNTTNCVTAQTQCIDDTIGVEEPADDTGDDAPNPKNKDKG